MFGSSPEERTPRKRAPRRRAVSSAEDEEIRPVRQRRTVSRRNTEGQQVVEVAPPQSTVEVQSEATRKAPTPIAAEKRVDIRKRKQLITVMVLLCVGVGSSAAVGYLDKGQINVEETIEARNERIRNNQPDERDVITSTIEVPVQQTVAGAVDGGLIGRGTGGQAPVPVVVASTTASTTDTMATSTEAMASSSMSEAETEEAEPSALPQENSPEPEATE